MLHGSAGSSGSEEGRELHERSGLWDGKGETEAWRVRRGANMSHIVVLRPYSYGYKSSSAAKVTYKHAADDSALQTSYSNDLGLVPVLSSKDDDKLAEPHIVSSRLLTGPCILPAIRRCLSLQALPSS